MNARIRTILFYVLVLAAPFSKIPSIGLPLFGFVSFRMGLYQFLGLAFVAVSARSVYKNKTAILQKNKLGLLLIILMACMAIGTIGAISLRRNLLLSVSFLFLLAVMLAGLDYTCVNIKKFDMGRATKWVLWAAIFYGVLSLLHLAIATFAHSGLLLCRGCGDSVFGFPRVNVFAAEPLFWANSLLPFFAVSLHRLYVERSRLGIAAVFMSTLAIGLTFARGAYIALVAGIGFYFVYSMKKSRLNTKVALRASTVVAAGFVVSWAMLVSSAATLHDSAPYIAYNTFRGMVQHVSLGTINLPPHSATIATNVAVDLPTTNIVNTRENFVSKGLVTASTTERTGSASLALRAMRHDFWTSLFGVGLGNLGLAARQYVDPAASADLTVYIYYVLFAAELGIIGLAALLSIFGSAVSSLVKQGHEFSGVVATILVMFLVQFVTFGSYINVVYIWLWLGIGLGMGVKLKKHENNKKIGPAVRKI